jgi:site-specific recombinase XerD
MDEILLSELIERAKDSIRSLEHSQSTIYQYKMAWKRLTDYFRDHDQALFSKQLAEQYILESKAKLDAGVIKRWRHKLNRLTVQMLIECFEEGHVAWKYHKEQPVYLHQSANIRLHADYLHYLKKEGKSADAIQTYQHVSRQFLEYLEQKKVKDIAEVGANEINSFVPAISKHYQPTTLKIELTALRCFLRYVEGRNLTQCCLSKAIPSSLGRTTKIVSIVTPEEEQNLLDSTDRTTAMGKRNYAMLLLALRTGLRSIDIINLKLEDIHWKRNTIEIVQSKTGIPLVLPLLTEVGNAIADYILNGRPDSQQPNVFLRSQAPYRKMSGHSACYAISRKMMKAAGIRQGEGQRKGFHCLRHTVAARLLAAETPLPIISSVLGHQNKESTKVYLSTDLEHLRTCALNLAGIEITKGELL